MSVMLINQDTTGISPQLIFGTVTFSGRVSYCLSNAPPCQERGETNKLQYICRVMGATPTGELVLCDARAREACENNLVGVLRNR